MLHKPDVNTDNLMKLADRIDGLSEDRFSMLTWGTTGEPRCICGWLMHDNARMEKDDWRGAAQMLGIDDDTAHRLFCNPRQTKDEAVARLRKLAVVGAL